MSNRAMLSNHSIRVNIDNTNLGFVYVICELRFTSSNINYIGNIKTRKKIKTCEIIITFRMYL